MVVILSCEAIKSKCTIHSLPMQKCECVVGKKDVQNRKRDCGEIILIVWVGRWENVTVLWIGVWNNSRFEQGC